MSSLLYSTVFLEQIMVIPQHGRRPAFSVSIRLTDRHIWQSCWRYYARAEVVVHAEDGDHAFRWGKLVAGENEADEWLECQVRARCIAMAWVPHPMASA